MAKLKLLYLAICLPVLVLSACSSDSDEDNGGGGYPEFSAETGEVSDKKSTSATLEATFHNLPAGAEAGVEVWSEKSSYSYTQAKSTQQVSAGVEKRQYEVKDLKPNTEYSYSAYILYEGTYYSGETLTFTLGGCPDEHHPHAIDLGLPSGTKWCCCNVGASKPEDYGGYYAWGETSEKSEYNHVTYAYCSGQDTDGDGWYDKNLSYVNIGSDIAGTSYDVARVRMGGSWRMPSYAMQSELWNYCSLQWTTRNGVYGMLVTGNNGGQIFLPAAGYRNGTDLNDVGSFGYYWSSSLLTDSRNYAWYLFFFPAYRYMDNDGRCYGLSVRPVR